jgi:hypothetical protein
LSVRSGPDITSAAVKSFVAERVVIPVIRADDVTLALHGFRRDESLVGGAETGVGEGQGDRPDGRVGARCGVRAHGGEDHLRELGARAEVGDYLAAAGRLVGDVRDRDDLVVVDSRGAAGGPAAAVADDYQ